MKKFAFIAALAALAATGAFAQAKGAAAAKNALSVDVVPLVKGIIASDTSNSAVKTSFFGLGVFYERDLGKNYAFGMRMDLYIGKLRDISVSFFGVDAHGRWYPLSPSLEKLFLDAGIGVSVLNYDGSNESGFMGLTIALKTGWKHKFSGKVFMEPSIAYVLAKSEGAGLGAVITVPVIPLGWQIGLGVGMVF